MQVAESESISNDKEVEESKTSSGQMDGGTGPVR